MSASQQSDLWKRRTDKVSQRRSAVVFGLALLVAISAPSPAGIAANAKDTTADSASDSAAAPALVYLLDITSEIGPVTNKRIQEAIETAEENDAEALLITLDTPGGLTKSTWSIDKAILNSHVPVIVYIAPAGARAGSAGVFITYAAHFAAMAPGTNIGAAHPVSGDGQKTDSTMNEKVTNDAVASIQAMAEKRGRNREWAERAVRESVSITDNEALTHGVVNVRAASRKELYAALDGRKAETPAGTRTLHLGNVQEEPLDITFIEKILQIIASPDIAFLLLSVGGLGLILELYNPGAILPGVIGGISLILAFFALQTLPINIAGLLLIVFALILFIAEIKVVSYGLLTVGGIISLILGGLFLFDSVDPTIHVSATMISSVAIGLAGIFGAVIYFVARTHRKRVFTGAEGMVGIIGVARSPLAPDGMALVAGELWRARSAEGSIEQGEAVVVERVDGLSLLVRKKA